MRPLQLSRAVWVVPPLLFGPAVVYAQADSGAPASAELIAQARAQLRARQLDSAAVLLRRGTDAPARSPAGRSEEHTSEIPSPCNFVCRLLVAKKTHWQH